MQKLILVQETELELHSGKQKKNFEKIFEKKFKKIFEKIFEKNRKIFFEELGTGAFGTVHRGTWKPTKDDKNSEKGPWKE